MDRELIFYIILAIIALVSQLLKRKKPTTTSSDDGSSERTPRPQKKPFSFDDILKEFQQEMIDEKEEQKPVQETIPSQETTNRERIPPRSRKPKDYKSYEGTSYESFEGSDFSSPDVISDDKRESLLKYKRDDHYALSDVSYHPILEMLKTEDGPKNAIILSEIINRKYV